MDMQSRKQYLQAVQKDYLKAGRLEKQRLLDEAEHRTGLDRNYITQRLSAKTQWRPIEKRKPRPKEFGSELVEPLVRIWDIFDEACGQRLASSIADELERLRDFGEVFATDGQAAQLKKMSARTIDRLLEHERSVRLIAEKYIRNDMPLLYQKIPTKLSDEWDRNLLGQIQVDGVEHCGASAQGEYVNTINSVDIASYWWEGSAVMGKGKERALGAIKEDRKRSPINWKEMHPDNGMSFINYFVYDYANETKLEFSRSRPFKKNDNCFVEQNNSRNVRRVVGHVRYDTLKEMNIINDLYRNELRLYKNFFQPVMRLETKERLKGHIHREYQIAKTPYRYLMDHPDTPAEVKIKLQAQYESLNPADLKRKIEAKLKLLAAAYQTKHSQVPVQNEDAKLRFPFGTTTALGLGS